jgi:hypothetical protein
MITRNEWKKQFKNCEDKANYERAGSGGTLSRCCIRASYNFVGFNRCMYSKCPKINQKEEETGELI